VPRTGQPKLDKKAAKGRNRGGKAQQASPASASPEINPSMHSKAIVLRVPTPPDKPWQISQDEVAILKNAICKGATDEELKFCLAVARRHKLDPFRGQIWFVKRKDSTAVGGYRWIPIVGIGGMLHIAARDHEDFGSNDEPEFGPMHEVKWSYYEKSGKFQAPEWAKVTLWKKGLEHPTVATVWWDEIYPDVGAAPLVRQMPRLMLGKCALAQAIRRAYPTTDGLYIKEEFQGREQFTETGREIVFNEPAQLEEARVDPNWQAFLNRLTPEEREREMAAVAKQTPEQREVLEAKKAKLAAQVQSPSATPRGPESSAAPGSGQESRQTMGAPPRKADSADGTTRAQASVPCLFYRWNGDTQQAIIHPQPHLNLNASLKKAIAKGWSETAGAAIFNGEELEALKFQFERAGMEIRRLKQ
jgi:RecT family protein